MSHAIPRAEKGQLLSSLRMAQLDIISLLGVVQCGTIAGEHLSGAQGSKAGTAPSGRSPRLMKDSLISMRKNTTEKDRVVVLTLSLVTRLKRGLVREPWVETICNIKAVFHTTYIPGHEESGITISRSQTS